ncbi:hypothetical protein B0H10DRAFT_1700166, partial [Mycena sp. CBHHK59/15]
CDFLSPGMHEHQFDTCNTDMAYLLGWYPEVTDSTTSFSTFMQYYTGYYTGADSSTTLYTIGDTVMPSTAYFMPSSSNCMTSATISNGIAAVLLTSGAISAAATTVKGWSGTGTTS